MNFFFKSKKIVLDCFTDNPFYYETARINHAIKYLPEWWKKLPTNKESNYLSMDVNVNKKSTVKNCPGFIDLYKKSLVIPHWNETRIKVNSDGTYEWISSHETNIENHPGTQFDGWFSNATLAQVKFICPWFAKSKENLQLFFAEPLWNNENINDLRIIPGVINTKYQYQLSVNCFIEPNPKGERIINSKPLTPLVFLVPLTDKTIELRHHLISTREVVRFKGSHNFNYPNMLSMRIKNINKIEELNKPESKCPFGFKKR
jgi:hypothetical protein